MTKFTFLKGVKTWIFCALALFAYSQAISQSSYTVNYVDSAKNPLGLNTDGDATTTGWTSITTSPQSTNSWSDTVAIPFKFNFFGSPVTHIRASQNGLITFSKNPTKLPFRENTNLPSDSLPDSTIAVFWDEFTTSAPTGSGDVIYVKTFGKAPHRQFYIRWHSFEMGDYSSFNYFAAALEEGTDKIYIVDMSYYSSNLSFTVGVQLNNKIAVQYKDSTLTWAKTSSSLNSNNSYYEFDPFTLQKNDVGITAITSPSEACNLTSKETIEVSIYNNSPSTITTIPIAYQIDGGKIIRETFKGTLASLGTISYKFNTTADLSKTKKYNISAWSEYSSDPNSTNDTSVKTLDALSGTYVIGKGEDFENFSEAVMAIKSNSVCGNVVFEVKGGTYTEQIELSEFKNASSTNTVTFRSKSGDSTDVILQYGQTSSSDNYVVKFNGGDWYRLENITIKSISSSSYSQVITIGGGADNNKISNCVIEAPVSSSSSTNYALVYSNTDNDNNNTFTNNVLEGGSSGFYLYGSSSSSLEEGTVIEGNKINCYYYSIRVYYQDAPQIISNYMAPDTKSSTHYGIYAGYSDNGLVIANNQVLFPGISGYGIYIYYSDGDAKNPAQVYNNMVTLGSTSTAYGLYNYYSTYVNYYYNTIEILSTGTYYGSYITGSTSSNLRYVNNIFSNSGGGYPFYVSSTYTSAIIEMDYNSFYSSGANIAYYGSAITSLSDLQTASSMNANSIVAQPFFNSTYDLHTKTIAFNESGKSITGITTDIDGDKRETKPDIGADEFEPLKNDLTALSVVMNNSNCGDSNTYVSLIVQNLGTSSQKSIPIGYKIVDLSSSSSTSIVASDTINATLANTESDTLTFNKTFNTYQGGRFYIQVYTNLSTDQDKTNDTASYLIQIDAIPLSPVGIDANRCGNGKIKLTAKSANGLEITWYDAKTGGKKVAVGENYEPTLNQTTTYYASAASIVNTSFSTTYNDDNGCSSGNMFNITTNSKITIDSFAANYSGTNGYVRVYYKVGSFIGYDNDSTAWTFLGDANPTPNTSGTPTNFSVGKTLEIPANTTYGIYIMFDARYTNGNSSFTGKHFTIADGVGHCSDFSSAIADRIWNGTIYYKAAGCESPRTPVTASINQLARGIAVSQGKPFNGISGSGTAISPDTVCISDTLSYEITPPTGYTNGEFGSKWVITSLTTEDGNGNPASNTNTSNPSSTSNGVFQLIAANSEANKLFKIEVTAKIIGSNCDTTFSRYVYIAPSPTASFSVNNSCIDESIEFKNNSTIGSYIWDFGDQNSSTTRNPSHTYTSSGNKTISLQVTSIGGCSSTANASINIYDKPNTQFTAANTCLKDAIQLNNSSTIAIGNIASYTWNFGDSSQSNRKNPTYKYSEAGSYTIELTATSNNGCSKTVSKTVEVFDMPKADFSATNACVSDSLTFSNMSSIVNNSPLKSTWNFGNGNMDTRTNSQFKFANDGKYVVELSVTSDDGCSDIISKTVEVYPLPTAAFSTKMLCEGDSTEFVSTNTTDITNYNWEIEGNTFMQEKTAYQFDSAGTYDVALTVTSNMGCKGSTSMPVVISKLPVADFTAKDACVGDEISFTNQSSSDTDITVYSWNFGSIANSIIENPKYAFALDGEYQVTLQVTDALGCMQSINKKVSVFELPDAEFTFSHMGNGLYQFTPSTNGLSSYSWDFGDGNTSNDESPKFKFDSEGLKTISLITTNTNGCEQSNTEYIGVSTSITSINNSDNKLYTYPNPFTHNTTIHYELQNNSKVVLEVFDISGKKVASLINANQVKGIYQYDFNTTIPSGVFFVHLQIDGVKTIQKIVKSN